MNLIKLSKNGKENEGDAKTKVGGRVFLFRAVERQAYSKK